MSITQIPSKGQQPSRPPVRPDGSELYEAQRWESAYRKFDADAVPHLLIQLEDDLARSRKREAKWKSSTTTAPTAAASSAERGAITAAASPPSRSDQSATDRTTAAAARTQGQAAGYIQGKYVRGFRH